MINVKPQKVQHLADALELKVPKLDGIFMISEKLDGWFVTIEYCAKTKTWFPPRSSAGRTIPSLLWTVELFEHIVPTESCFLIAEATIDDLPFHLLNGMLNRSVGDFACKDVVFNIHDVVYFTNKHTAIERYKLLDEIETTSRLRKIPLILVSAFNKTLWTKVFEEQVNKGAEGIVAKRASSIYSFGKRNSDLLKLKLETTVDALAGELEEGIGEKGERSLTLVSYRANGVKIRTVISKHSDQELFRTDASSILGKVVEIKAMEELADGQLRQPVFKCIREDKRITDIN
jgi:ATP-dependent DNA ligase